MEAPERLDAITNYIIANHNRKTHSREFTAIFCVSNVDTLIKYYNLFQQKKEAGEHNLRIATIFSYNANEDDKGAVGDTWTDDEFAKGADPPASYGIVEKSQHTREHLEVFIGNYNKMFATNYGTKDSQSFDKYYNDMAKRVKHEQVDILLVVNMFLTGFDSKSLNTIYVDKNLRYHGLIQAYSRTNRILNELKSQGNIVTFRNLKERTDEAISLFSNINAKDEIIMQPYEEYVEKMNAAFIALLQIAPTVNSVNNLKDEEEELAFAKAFRELMRLKNILSTFTEFTFDDLSVNKQTFEDYKSKYLDLYDKVKSHDVLERVSILQDIDFELELIHRDEINVAYILKLLAKLKDATPEDKEQQEKAIYDIIAGDTRLRSKRELIEKFINQHLPLIEDSEDIGDEFANFISIEKMRAIKDLSDKEDLDATKLENVIGDYLFTEKKPLRDDIVDLMNQRPSLKERKVKSERVTSKILKFIETFINGISKP